MAPRQHPPLGGDPTLDGSEPDEAGPDGLPSTTNADDSLVSSKSRGRSEPSDDPGMRTLERGDAVGRYVVLERVGAGGMGVVYAAWDPDLDRKVALKLLHGGHDPAKRADKNQRLLREAQAMARLSHPNVITVHDVGEFAGRVFVAMEFIEGRTLSAWLQGPGDQPRASDEILDVWVRAGRGLAAAHEHGLIHRDFKPDNVMIGDDGRIRVMDFGLVRATDDKVPEPSATLDLEAMARPSDLAASADDDQLVSSTGGRRKRPSLDGLIFDSSSVLDSRITLDGALLGTPAYMAPEQLQGQLADARSDQFAFCVAVWESLYGQRPFAGDNPMAVLFAISSGKLREPPPGRAVAKRVRKALERGLSARPEQRWSSMRSLLSALAYDPSARRGRALGLGSLLIAVAAAVTAGLLSPEAPVPVPPCEQAGREIDSRWTEARREALAQRFAQSELIYANDSWAQVARNLDAWAGEWSASRRDACEASEVRHEQSPELLDLRMACLDRRLGRFTALLEVYAEADAAVVEKAVEASEALPRLEPCSDRAWLQAAERPPEDPAQAAAVEALRGDFDRIAALIRAGKSGEALPLAQTASERANELAWPAAIAEAGLLVGQAQLELGDFEASRPMLERAYLEARRAGDDDATMAADTLLIYVSVVGFSDFDGARRWIDLGQAEGDRVGDDLLLADVFAGIGVYHYMRDEQALAAEAFAKALALGDDAPGVTRGQGLINYGTVLVRADAKQQGEALAVLAEGLAMLEANLGRNHPMIPTAMSNMATAISQVGRKQEAIDLLERALAISARVNGEAHPMTALIQLNEVINILELPEGGLERARELAEASLKTHRQVFGERHQMTAEAERAMGRVLAAQDQAEEAIRHFDIAIEIWAQVFGEHPTPAAQMAQVWRAQALSKLGERRQAQAALEALLASEDLGADARASAELTLALIFIADERSLDRASELLDQAKRRYEAEKLSHSLARVVEAQEMLARKRGE